MPMNHTAAKPTTAQSIEFLIAFEAVAPMYIPSHVNAAQPMTGIRSSHGMYSREASTTSGSEVIIFKRGTPANWYIPMNITAIPMLQTKVHLTV